VQPDVVVDGATELLKRLLFERRRFREFGLRLDCSGRDDGERQSESVCSTSRHDPPPIWRWDHSPISTRSNSIVTKKAGAERVMTSALRHWRTDTNGEKVHGRRPRHDAS
jgi:hypothetical protein